MTWREVKRDRADHYFSLYIRTRDKWRCVYCLKQFEVGAANLHNSHLFTRGRENTRFDPQNCDALCAYHHDAFSRNPIEYHEWKRRQMGEQAYNLLRFRSEQRCKRDRKLMVLVWKQEYQKLREPEG